jgi:hypothetical protein
VATFYGRLLLALSGFAGGLLVSARVLDRPWWVTCPAAALALIAGCLLLRWGPARALAWGWLAAVVTVLLGLTVAVAASWIQSV